MSLHGGKKVGAQRCVRQERGQREDGNCGGGGEYRQAGEEKTSERTDKRGTSEQTANERARSVTPCASGGCGAALARPGRRATGGRRRRSGGCGRTCPRCGRASRRSTSGPRSPRSSCRPSAAGRERVGLCQRGGEVEGEGRGRERETDGLLKVVELLVLLCAEGVDLLACLSACVLEALVAIWWARGVSGGGAGRCEVGWEGGRGEGEDAHSRAFATI